MDVECVLFTVIGEEQKEQTGGEGRERAQFGYIDLVVPVGHSGRKDVELESRRLIFVREKHLQVTRL